MIKKKKILSFMLIAALSAMLFACSSPEQNTGGGADENPEGTNKNARFTEDGRRIITIGTWYNRYYVSKHNDIFDDPGVIPSDGTPEGDKRIEIAQKRLDNIRRVEQKYNVVLEYVNMTFDGVQESIRTSIPGGAPDVDVYETDLWFAIPAVLRGWAEPMEGLGLIGTDVFTDQHIMKYLRLLGQDETYLFNPALSGATSAYTLSFNLDMIKAAGLADPRDLYDRGEWTWDVWREYLKALTVERKSQGLPDIYGWSGYWSHLLQNLLFSNNTAIAAGEKEMLSSPETMQVLEFIYDIYNIDKTARPWDESNWDINNRLYAEGLSGFWVGADWLFQEQGGDELPFEIGVVPWPCGPNGNDDTNTLSTPAGNWYMIPEGVEDPRFVYDVIFDWLNWYDWDTELGADNEWSRRMFMNDRNFEYAAMMAARPGFDMWESLGREFGFGLMGLLSGSVLPDDIVSEYSGQYQQVLDRFFRKGL